MPDTKLTLTAVETPTDSLLERVAQNDVAARMIAAKNRNATLEVIGARNAEKSVKA